MSKSSESKKGVIYLLDDLDIIRKKIMSATTDSDNYIKFDVENKPGISNLINIYASLSGLNIQEVEEKFKDSNYGEFKKEVANLVVEKVSTIQEKYNELLKSDKLEEILNDGIEAVRPMAKKKYEIMKQKLGLGIK